jgi:hypothetical protein
MAISTPGDALPLATKKHREVRFELHTVSMARWCHRFADDAHGAPAHALYLAAHEAACGASSRAPFSPRHLGGPAQPPVPSSARPGTRCLSRRRRDRRMWVEDEMDRAEPRIATGHVVRRLVQKHARRILKNDRAIVRAQLPASRPE